MPSVLSTLKDGIYGREWSFPYNCYEVGHGWTPFCTDAAFGVGLAAFQNSLPLYSSLYLFTQLGLQRKYDAAAFYETFKSILTSASFLGFNFFGGIGVSCLLRNNSDRYYYRIQCLLPAFIASYLALLIERPSRRPALAFYLANMSSELLYKSAESHGYIKSLPHGETLLFVLGMACWMRFVRINGFGHDPVSTALKYLIGPLEAKSRARVINKPVPSSDLEYCEVKKSNRKSVDESSQIISSDCTQPDNQIVQKTTKSTKNSLQQGITDFLNTFLGSHPTCPHKGMSCVDYSITPAITRFGMGYLIRSFLNLGGSYKLLINNPSKAFTQAFTSKSSVNFGLFLGTFVGSMKASHCILRRCFGKQEVWHSALAGGISGTSMLFAPRSTLSTYIIWKCLEQYFFLAVQKGKITHPNEIICLVYAVSVNVLLYIFALEPRFIRPSYMKFIDKISDHRLHQVNRMGK